MSMRDWPAEIDQKECSGQRYSKPHPQCSTDSRHTSEWKTKTLVPVVVENQIHYNAALIE
jgi:hypothetical protein